MTEFADLRFALGLIAQSQALRRFGVVCGDDPADDLVELQSQGVNVAPEGLAQTIVTVLDAVSTAAFVLNDSGRVLALTSAARRLLGPQDALRLVNDRLEASAASGLQLHQLMKRVLQDADAEARTVLESDAGPLLLEATRLIATSAAPPQPWVLLLIARRQKAHEPLEARIRTAFRLTAAEADVGSALCDGLSPEEIARRRGVSIGTVRVQLRELFAKTDTQRQSQLVSRLLSYA